MTRRTEQEYLLQAAWRQQLLRGEIDRRQFLARALVAGLGLAGVSVATRFGLPTARAARYANPLGVYEFQKRSSVIGCTPEGAKQLAGIAGTLADAEGLQAHAQSARDRS